MEERKNNIQVSRSETRGRTRLGGCSREERNEKDTEKKRIKLLCCFFFFFKFLIFYFIMKFIFLNLFWKAKILI